MGLKLEEFERFEIFERNYSHWMGLKLGELRKEEIFPEGLGGVGKRYTRVREGELF